MSKKTKGKKNKDFDSDLEEEQSLDKRKSKGSRNDVESNEKVSAKSSKKKKGKKAAR